MDSKIQAFSHVLLPVPDVAATIQFYTTHLGFNVLRHYSMGGSEMAYLELGGVLLEVIPFREEEASPTRMDNPFGLLVSDLDSLLADLKGKGVECGVAYDARTFWGRQAKIRDNSGYLVSLRQYDQPDGPLYPGWRPRHANVTRLA